MDQVNISLSRQELLQILKESSILSAEELEAAASVDPQSDGQALADALVGSGILTAFQMDALVNGRHEKLRIGNYDVLDKLGTGGTGTVFKAHRRLKRTVALKVLARNLCKDKTFVRRFQREVETMAQLDHPNIVMAYDADETKIGHFLVMEFVDGQDLATVVQKKGPMSLAEAVSAILQAARGMAYVHGRGMIHRDIKPANLLRNGSGLVKVTDLGLARFATGGGGGPLAANSLTQAGGVLGTVDYMSPEQAMDSTNIDHRSDVYSLGATLYFLLVGEPPYPGHTMMDTLLKHRDAPIPLVSASRPDAPTDLDEIVRKMLGKTPASRYQTMTEIVSALEAVQAHYGDTAVFAPSTVTAPPASPAKATVTVVPPTPAPTPRPTLAPRAVSDFTMDLPPGSQEVNASLNVLVVEPSRTQASIIGRYLRSQNIENVALATSGEETLRAIRTKLPDAIVCAMYLQDMTGIQLAHQVRKEFSETPPGFVLVSSEFESAEANALSKTGQTALLQKPFSPDQLIEALSTVTGQLLMSIPISPEKLGLTLVKPVTGIMPKSPLPAPAPKAEEVAEAPAAPKAKPARDIAYDQIRVLVVDDSRAARTHICGVLSDLGVTQITEATDGAQAVASLVRESFDLIVTDYNMPLMDGRNLIGYLKQNPAMASIPVIMVTTETDEKKLAAIRALGVAAICDKEFPPEVVLAIIDQVQLD